MERSVAERNLPIQVAALCDTTGKLHPLWFRYADEAHQVRKVNIDAVLSQKTLRYVGIRMEQYICASDVGRILRTFKIKKNVEVTDNGKIII